MIITYLVTVKGGGPFAASVDVPGSGAVGLAQGLNRVLERFQLYPVARIELSSDAGSLTMEVL